MPPPLSAAAALIFSGCLNPMVVVCRDGELANKTYKYTKQQKDAACERIHLHADSQITRFNKETKKWELNLDGVQVKDLKSVLESQAKDLDFYLSYQEQKFADTIDWFRGLRSGLEKQEAITHEILRRLLFASVLKEFEDKVGVLPAAVRDNQNYKYFFPKGVESYSIRLLHSRPDFRLESTPFLAAYLETAKQEGTLKLVGSVEWTSDNEFAKKIPDLYNPNDFKWESRKLGVVILGYKIVPADGKPDDGAIQYLEIVRKQSDGEKEDKPAVRGFLASGGSRVQVFLIDYERKGQVGYGAPDEVWVPSVSVQTAGDILESSVLRQKLVESIFERTEGIDRDRPARQKPPERPIYLAIAKMGDMQLDLWQKGDWSVPFKHSIFSSTLELAFAPAKSSEESRRETQEGLKQILGFKRTFRAGGNIVVVEFWKPKSDYVKRNVTDASAYLKTVRVLRKNALEELGEVGFFATLHMIDYQLGGKWFRLLDEDGDGVFEKKKEVADSTAIPVPVDESSLGVF